MTTYFSEIYFKYLIIMIGAYFAVWIIAWLLARFIKGGNPYINVFTCWSIPLMFHSLALIILVGITTHSMAQAERESIEIFLYCIGYIVLLIINCIILTTFWNAKKKVRFAS